ncbi:hypothetical protein WN944_010458 [Citrus x changshan-huyou]|uniref:Uncharacterized protein n=1 Tax=Citrus x changshan-huyou TaxID=2935761 RepID=A0AAP0QX55_9ROSI
MGTTTIGLSLKTVISIVSSDAEHSYEFQSLQTIHNKCYFTTTHASFLSGGLRIRRNERVFESTLKRGQESTAFNACM